MLHAKCLATTIALKLWTARAKERWAVGVGALGEREFRAFVQGEGGVAGGAGFNRYADMELQAFGGIYEAPGAVQLVADQQKGGSAFALAIEAFLGLCIGYIRASVFVAVKAAVGREVFCEAAHVVSSSDNFMLAQAHSTFTEYYACASMST
jgi:hypothetical protein